MYPRLASLVVLAASMPAAAEQVWEVRGELVAIESGASEVAVLRLPDGRQVRVPLESLSESSRAAARQVGAKQAADAALASASPEPRDGSGGGTIPEFIRDVEADALRCRTAADAAAVYRLFLAGPDRPKEATAAATDRLRHWTALAEQGMVRLGGRQVPPEEARTAARDADKEVEHAIELMRLGNAELAEEALKKAGRVDPESGRAAFLIGLSYALLPRNAAKAYEHFADAARRDPADPAVLNNLAVTEILTRRSTAAVDHLRAALASAGDPRPVADNVAWAIKHAAAAKNDPRYRMPAKTVNDLNELYRVVTQDMKLKPPETIAAPHLLGPDGTPCTATSLGELARVVSVGWPAPTKTRCLGFVIAPGRVVCPRQAVVLASGSLAGAVELELAADRARRCTAKVVAAPEESGVALLECATLDVATLPLAKAWPSEPGIEAIGGTLGSWLGGDLLAVRGTAVSPEAAAGDAADRGLFVHTALLPRGLGGGPIMDAAGRVLGMVAPTPATDASGNAGGFGVPLTAILRGLADHLPQDAGEQPPSDQPAAGSRGLAGTVLVSVADPPPREEAKPAP
jgi:Flp pilus assembly protein TadD